MCRSNKQLLLLVGRSLERVGDEGREGMVDHDDDEEILNRDTTTIAKHCIVLF